MDVTSSESTERPTANSQQTRGALEVYQYDDDTNSHMHSLSRFATMGRCIKSGKATIPESYVFFETDNEQEVLLFLHSLRALLRRYPHACASICLPPQLSTDAWSPGWTQRLGWLSDSLLSLSAFTGMPVYMINDATGS